MWRELLTGLSAERRFREPASPFRLDEAETELQVKFPDELHGLLRESDGVEGEHGLGLAWPLERIVEDNLRFRREPSFRELYMPFDHLLFFGDAGNCDQFAFPIHADGAIHRPDVFAWNHEDDSRSWIAPSLKIFFEWFVSGQAVTGTGRATTLDPAGTSITGEAADLAVVIPETTPDLAALPHPFASVLGRKTASPLTCSQPSEHG